MRLSAVTLGLLGLAAITPAAADWLDWPSGPRDWQLEAAVRAAYAGAAAYARTNTNYFARDESYDGLRDAMATELARQGIAGVAVSLGPVADLAEARACAVNGIELRYVVTMFGDGISIAAASPSRVFSYHYDPHEDATIIVAPAAPC